MGPTRSGTGRRRRGYGPAPARIPCAPGNRREPQRTRFPTPACLRAAAEVFRACAPPAPEARPPGGKPTARPARVASRTDPAGPGASRCPRPRHRPPGPQIVPGGGARDVESAHVAADGPLPRDALRRGLLDARPAKARGANRYAYQPSAVLDFSPPVSTSRRRQAAKPPQSGQRGLWEGAGALSQAYPEAQGPAAEQIRRGSALAAALPAPLRCGRAIR
jgi:hypothetical protein